ncbi:hypothetical protein J3Q64DRAFT_1706956 [Phycomyces blakesleeanus]|uniref:RRM domain-containing protein n=1 Tax=Phycomyces blakesleeanus TaxID=4837 RepID=A0ABR3BCW8_PHYBL
MFNRTLAVAARQTAQTVRIAPRCLYSVQATGETRLPDTRRHDNRRKDFAGNLIKKFTGQVRRANEPNESMVPTTLVRIDYLPSTATAEDIRKLVREATQKNGENIKEVVFCRTPTFHFKGRCLVHLNNTEDAASLVKYAHRRLLAGKVLNAGFGGEGNEDNVSSLLAESRTRELGSVADGTNYSGRAVEIVGFPLRSTVDHVSGKLRFKNVFPIEGVDQNLVELKTAERSSVSKFLVKFATEAEAWRCVRTFHNTRHVLRASHTYEFELRVSVVY